MSNLILCPVCGNTLIKRTGKYGVFYSCSGYPKCGQTMSEAEYKQRLSKAWKLSRRLQNKLE